MLLRFRKAVEKKDEGFTLIELLVVMIIIGILAAIAIPIFLNQRNNAYDSQVKNDLRNAATAIESAAVDQNGEYGWLVVGNLGTPPLDFTPSQTIAVDARTDTTYCIEATSQSGDSWHYENDGNGVVAGVC